MQQVKKHELTDLYLKMRARNLPNSPVAAYIQVIITAHRF
jgi:hypothetical protein